MKNIAAFLLLAAAPLCHAATLQSAKVTRVVNEVKIYKPGASAKAAKIGSTVTGKTSVQTGPKSRSELKFQDSTITRLGANTVFSFQQGTRDLQLKQGTLLLQVPKNAVGRRVTINEGQMLFLKDNGQGIPRPVDVDLARLMTTSRLVLLAPLNPSALGAINRRIAIQTGEKKDGTLVSANLVPRTRGDQALQDQRNVRDVREDFRGQSPESQ